MKGLIFDYETLSQNKAKCPIVALALHVFDTEVFLGDEPYTMDRIRSEAEFYKFDVAEQVESYDRRPSRDTLNWWKENVDADTQKWLLTPTKEDVSIATIPSIFARALAGVGSEGKNFVVCRGPTFDMAITYALCEQLEVSLPWNFWQERDSRSLIDGVLWQTDMEHNFVPEGLGEYNLHNPIDDIAMDVLRLQLTQRVMAGLDV